MRFRCGCKVETGQPIPYETIREHYEHTMEALLFWELIFRKGQDLFDDKTKLSEARIALMEAIDKMFPEASEEVT